MTTVTRGKFHAHPILKPTSSHTSPDGVHNPAAVKSHHEKIQPTPFPVLKFLPHGKWVTFFGWPICTLGFHHHENNVFPQFRWLKPLGFVSNGGYIKTPIVLMLVGIPGGRNQFNIQVRQWRCQSTRDFLDLLSSPSVCYQYCLLPELCFYKKKIISYIYYISNKIWFIY